ncbi:MAG: hypothetical protein AAF490_04440 [Chloroflexota bacterium]
MQVVHNHLAFNALLNQVPEPVEGFTLCCANLHRFTLSRFGFDMPFDKLSVTICARLQFGTQPPLVIHLNLP